MQFSYWPILASVTARANDQAEVSGGLLALGFALIPFVFITAAIGTKHKRGPMAVLKAMGLFLVFGVPLMMLDVATGTVAGFAAGAVTALRRDEPHSLAWRWSAAGAATVYILLLRLTALQFALLSGAVVPFAVHGLVDQARETRDTGE